MHLRIPGENRKNDNNDFVPGFMTDDKNLSARKSYRIYILILIVALMIFNDFRLIAAVYEQGTLAILFLVVLYIAAFLCFALLLLNRSRLVRTIAQILLFSSLYTDMLYIILGGFPFSYPDAINLFNNPEYASGAIITFKTAFVLAFPVVAIVYSSLHLSLKAISRSYSPAWVLLLISIQAGVYMGSKKIPGLYDLVPLVYRVEGNLLSAKTFRPEEQWRRAGVTEKPGLKNAKHIFLVVDESVTGDALSINGFPVSTTPFLESNAEKFINFGTATSFTNFSAGSNLSLMSGMLVHELPDKEFVSFAKPSIFQFAKKAGYKTFLLDAQSGTNKFQNYTTAQDRVFIDSIFKPGVIFPYVPSYSRDSVMAEEITSIAAMDSPTFTYVNKAGAHWPFNTNYPPDSLQELFSSHKTNQNTEAIRYFKSLYWNVDKFWQIFVRRLPVNSNVLILYTSDHGERYNEKPFRVKHASIYNTHAEEGLVPLLVFDRANFFPRDFTPAINSYSHQYIFPTILSAMGYDKNFIRDNYGKTLLEPPDSKSRWFHTGDLFGRGKSQRVYVDEPRISAKPHLFNGVNKRNL